MNIRPSDLIRLKKDIARVREHEEKLRARETSEESKETAPGPQSSSSNQKESVPVSVLIRKLFEDLLDPRPSKESLEAIPEYLVTVLQVIYEEPKFRKWLLQLEGFPLKHRNQQLERMSRAFRIEDGSSIVAATFDQLHEPALFKAVCQFLRGKNACQV